MKNAIGKIFGCLLLFSSLQGEEFPLCPIEKIDLRTDYIALHHPVSTENPAAQLFFDQGLTMMYAFNHDAAFCSFQQASLQDPQLAMAYWGMALALGPNINLDITHKRERAAYDLIRKALELSSNATDNEKGYIHALVMRYSNVNEPDRKKLSQDYFEAMKRLMQKFPDDPDAAVLFAESGLDLNPWNQWTVDGKPQGNTLEIITVLENVLKRDPSHLGANHFYIHAVEASEYPEKALVSANRLRHLSKVMGHILHMPSHIYILVGDYHQAAQANEEAAAADREYMREYGTKGFYPVHYLSHNLYFLSRAYSMEGRYADALRAAEELKELYLPHFKMMPDLEYYYSAGLFVNLRFQHWKEALQVAAPKSEMAVSNALWHFGRSLAYVGLGELEKAKEEKNLFLEQKEKISPGAEFGYNKALPVLNIAENLIKGKLAEAEHNMPVAIEYLQNAVKLQDSLHYNEPPDWFFPIRESLGGALWRDKKYKEAEEVFRQDLSKHPRNGRSLFGLMMSLIKQSKENGTYWVKKEYEEAWKYSDAILSMETL